MHFVEQVEQMTQEWVEKFKVVPGKTKVKVSKFPSGYAGIQWVGAMDLFVGRTVTVEAIRGKAIRLTLHGDTWTFPYSFLEVVQSKEPIEVVLNSRYTAVVTDKVVVGCQTLTEEHLDAIEAGIKQYQSKHK